MLTAEELRVLALSPFDAVVSSQRRIREYVRNPTARMGGHLGTAPDFIAVRSLALLYAWGLEASGTVSALPHNGILLSLKAQLVQQC